MKLILPLLLLLFLLPQQASDAIPADLKQSLERISEDSLRGHLSFIASDLLEGRATPSPGLDIAAEYIAAQFRRAGLEPVGDDGYFQTANWRLVETPAQEFALSLSNGEDSIALSYRQITALSEKGLSLTNASLVKGTVEELTRDPAKVAGKNIIVEAPGRPAAEIVRAFASLSANLVLIVDRANGIGRGLAQSRLVDPESSRSAALPASPSPVTVVLHDKRVSALYDLLPSGDTNAKVTVTIPPRMARPIKLRNVIGLLRGSDPMLRETCVLVTAHYDHIGIRPELAGDNIFNGANDDGSGTVSVIEIASALATLKVRPKRSLVFMTVFGEERGLLGSRYYGRHPIFPLAKTVADINLEHVGRTDSSEGLQVNRATLTGFDYSDLGPVFKKAGELTGIEVYKHEQNSDSFFGRSDNQALADAGVPAHTLCVAFVFPDYHRVGDHWDKIDYMNLKRTNQMVGLALWLIANNIEAPRWNEGNPKTARYVEAWKKLQGQ